MAMGDEEREVQETGRTMSDDDRRAFAKFMREHGTRLVKLAEELEG